jgi:hypothetical protein
LSFDAELLTPVTVGFGLVDTGAATGLLPPEGAAFFVAGFDIPF